MNDKILKEIFDGNIFPWEERSVRTPEITEMNKKIMREEEYFMSQMSERDKSRFDDLLSLLNARDGDSYSASRYKSFVMGIIVGMEIMEHKQSLLDER